MAVGREVCKCKEREKKLRGRKDTRRGILLSTVFRVEGVRCVIGVSRMSKVGCYFKVAQQG